MIGSWSQNKYIVVVSEGCFYKQPGVKEDYLR
jgi:hypothetical protein